MNHKVKCKKSRTTAFKCDVVCRIYCAHITASVATLNKNYVLVCYGVCSNAIQTTLFR